MDIIIPIFGSLAYCAAGGREAKFFSLNTILIRLEKNLTVQSEVFQKHFLVQLPEEDCFFIGSEILIAATVYDFANNAFRHAVKHKDMKARVTVSLSSKGDRHIIAVRDNGPGIQPEDILKIWEPFYTTDSTGIGLTNALVVAHTYGGTIEIISRAQGNPKTYKTYLQDNLCRVEEVDPKLIPDESGTIFTLSLEGATALADAAAAKSPSAGSLTLFKHEAAALKLLGSAA